jgi:diguanylate cyclase (GGDEF)-like protein
MEKPLALIIDDDRDTVAMFRHVLDMAGFKTEIVMRGEKAIERLKVIIPDIVLLDLNLPGVSGSKILEFIRADKKLAEVPVIVITGYAHMTYELGNNTDLILLKPVSIEQLSNLVLRLQPTNTKIPTDPPRDPETQLYNRSFFISRLQYSLERALQIGDNLFSVIYIDIDDFSDFVEKHGENVEKQVITETAIHLKSSIRPVDTIAQFSKNQFLILLEDLTGMLDSIKVAERIHAGFSPFIKEAFNLDLTISVGITYGGSEYENVYEILRQADIALYDAREGGGNQIKIFNEIIHGKYTSIDMYRQIARLQIMPTE